MEKTSPHITKSSRPYPHWRPEINALKEAGYTFNDPSEIVPLFEKKIAEWTGAPYAVATDCATHAIELCLRFTGPWKEIQVPKHTYLSVPQTVKKLNSKIWWDEEPWAGIYELKPTPVIDASLRLCANMYIPTKLMCLSFQIKKRLPIGRGGMILTDNQKCYEWLKRAVYDGRTPGVVWKQDTITQMGYHYYMTPEDAARGILLMDNGFDSTEDLGGDKDYPDLTHMDYFRNINLP